MLDEETGQLSIKSVRHSHIKIDLKNKTEDFILMFLLKDDKKTYENDDLCMKVKVTDTEVLHYIIIMYHSISAAME